MRLFSRKRKDVHIEEIRKEREASEARLAYAQHHIIEPLMRLRYELAQENHISERLEYLITESKKNKE